MVEDLLTDSVVSWSRGKNSFIVWDNHQLSTILLPKYFKHTNFSSFIRQRNTYESYASLIPTNEVKLDVVNATIWEELFTEDLQADQPEIKVDAEDLVSKSPVWEDNLQELLDEVVYIGNGESYKEAKELFCFLVIE
ncbi:hypothetical protein LguiB_028055 [Lonicera macranthoides]